MVFKIMIDGDNFTSETVQNKVNMAGLIHYILPAICKIMAQ